MPETCLSVDSETLVARSSTPTQPVAQGLMRYIARHGPPTDGQEVRYAWLTVRLQRDPSGALRLHLPAYDADQDIKWTADLTTPLALLVLQMGIAKQVGVEPEGFGPNDLIHVSPGAIEAEQVMMAREVATPFGDSGWYIRQDGPRIAYDHDYEAWPARRVLAARKGLLAPMALPAGLLIRIHGDDVRSVLDANGHERWPMAHSEAEPQQHESSSKLPRRDLPED